MTEQFFGKYTGKLGYGNMRLPRIDGKLDYDTIYKMIDTFMEAGYSASSQTTWLSLSRARNFRRSTPIN